MNQKESIITADLASGGVDAEKELIEIGPVPTSEILRISGVTSPSTVGVYTVLGELVFTASTSDPTFEIDLAGWTAGLYMIMLKTDKGTRARKFCIY